MIPERTREATLLRYENEILMLIAQQRPAAVVCARLVEMIESHLPETTVLLLRRRHGNVLQPVGTPVLSPLADAALGDAINTVTRDGALLAQRDVFLWDDLHRAPDWADYRVLTGGHDLRSLWLLPVTHESSGVLGALAVFNGVIDRADASRFAFLATMKRLAALVFHQQHVLDELVYQARHDALTGLPNRVLFEERLHDALTRADARGRSVAVFYIDLDHFKRINDRMGHSAGDSLLEQISERFVRLSGSRALLGRFGGDEFALFVEIETSDEAIRLAEYLLDQAARPLVVAERTAEITMSMGISLYPEHGGTVEELLQKADFALYESKDNGRNTYQVYNQSLHDTIVQRAQLQDDLARALADEALSVVYQPQIALSTGSLVGMEALVRWQHPTRGPISPGMFIPLAEDSGLIGPLGLWVLRAACRQNVAWQAAGYHAYVAVNVSAHQLQQPGFADQVAAILSETGLAPHWLELELTESALAQEDAVQAMSELRLLGVGVAIDDFGSGHSSLSYLSRLPVNTLKIDRSFVREIGPDAAATARAQAIIKAITAMSQTLGLSVVAEGIETDEQLAMLRQIGCDVGQGYLFSKPVAAPEFTAILSRAQPDPTL